MYTRLLQTVNLLEIQIINILSFFKQIVNIEKIFILDIITNYEKIQNTAILAIKVALSCFQ